MCSAAATGRRIDWSGRASILPVPHSRCIAMRPERVQQHGLAHPAQPGQHHAALRPAAGDPLQHHLELAELAVPPGEFGRPLPGAGRVRVPHRIHASDLCGI